MASQIDRRTSAATSFSGPLPGTTASGLTGILARSHLPALDGLRAIAVFVVILGHAEYPTGGIPSDLGVSAFFVLSGFLITRLLVREQAATGKVSLRRFYLRRTLRIFPAYYAFLALSLALDAAHGQRWSRALAASAVTYTVNYFNAFHHHPNTSIAHAWSLAVEEQFYLLWPVSFLWLSRRGRPMIVAGVTAAAIAAIVRRWLLLRGGADVAYLYNAFDTRFDNLAIGCVLALIVDYGSVVRAAEGAAAQAWFPCVTIALIIASRLGGSAPYHYSVGFTVDAVLVAILIVQLIQLADARMWSWLEHPATRYLGTISYPIYLYHQWGASVGRRVPISNRHAEFWAGVIATVLLATGSYFVIERPFLRLKQRFEPAR